MARLKYLIPFLFLFSAGCFNEMRFIAFELELAESVKELDRMIREVQNAYEQTSRADTLCACYRRAGVFDKMHRLHAQQKELLEAMSACCPDNQRRAYVERTLEYAGLSDRIYLVSRLPGQKWLPIRCYDFPDGYSTRSH